ncbi:DUF4224 domain-containing protein [Xenorhabdus sp. KK7.4]|uniref:DUF4224 domain-containing protein n=1 Tax=Xenorhabdus sp. KK7.4 TaxID=1851572 RepID=UPI000C0506F7|nr:DUF4224 domain-containing protein [Xenorhabdus sp. KK7.4]PHM48380.1 hypothetical protein Xekk_04449 [Xenorhabdus sp. KK7.4]
MTINRDITIGKNEELINSDIITDKEMEELTGFEMPSKQCLSLAKHGIFFITRQDGKPRTTWTHFNNPMAVVRRSHAVEEPDFENM